MSGIYRTGMAFAARARGRGDRGQTAAEYMGIVVIVAIIIVAIATSGLGTTIAGNITTKITEIFGAK
jgi:Flp pilus assembly pilin Flp